MGRKLQLGISRRAFLAGIGAVGGSILLGGQTRAASGYAMTLNLSCGRIGVDADQARAIDLAAEYGFESVDAYAGYLATLTGPEVEALRRRMVEKNLVWAAADLPVDFRNDQGVYEAGMAELPNVAGALARAGVNRVGTWLMFGSDEMTYREYGAKMTTRLREIALILAEREIRFGLEYVGTRSAWTSVRHPWVHTMAETLELIDDIGAGNVGLVLDSWHWFHAGESAADIRRLTNEQVVVVDLNDAPKGIAPGDMEDTKRELPASTGVIDVGTFLGALAEIGYDGPVRAEPFNAALNEMEDDAAAAATADAMRKAFGEIG